VQLFVLKEDNSARRRSGDCSQLQGHLRHPWSGAPGIRPPVPMTGPWPTRPTCRAIARQALEAAVVERALWDHHIAIDGTTWLAVRAS
jgi:hypothetical protein